MPETASQSVQTPHRQAVKLSPLGIADQLVQCWSLVLGPTDPLVHVLASSPGSGLDIASQFSELVLGLLVKGGNSGVDRGPERDVIPECERMGVAFLPYFPLASGLLTGKYRHG